MYVIHFLLTYHPLPPPPTTTPPRPQCRIYTLVNRVSIGSDNGLSPIRHQAIILTNAGISPIGPPGTNPSKISIKIQNFSLTKMHMKTSSAKWRPFCPGAGDELALSPWKFIYMYIYIYIYIYIHYIYVYSVYVADVSILPRVLNAMMRGI